MSRRLPTLVENASALALKAGVLSSIPTEVQRVNDSGLIFVIRLVEALKRKPTGTGVGGNNNNNNSKSDPFEEPEKSELFVEKLCESHSLLLNKFNVVPNHVLVVTTLFRPQTEPLTKEDFRALWKCLSPLQAMAFYNCGPNSGASQPHKHMQLIPRELDLPLERLMLQQRQQDGKEVSCFQFKELPFKHVGSLLNLKKEEEGDEEEEEEVEGEEIGAEVLEETYQRLLRNLRLEHELPSHPLSKRSYNFLMTTEWMFLVERSKETFDGISVNSVGFSGTLLVKSEEQLKKVKESGPLKILSQLAVAKDS